MTRVIVSCINALYRLGLAHAVSTWSEFQLITLETLDSSEPGDVIVIVDFDSVSRVANLMTAMSNVHSFKICILLDADDAVYVKTLSLPVAAYIHHRIDPERLRLALKVVLSGDSFIDQLLQDVIAVSAKDSNDTRADVELTCILTNREIEILKLIASGSSNYDIANSLKLSLSTIKASLRKMFSKLQLSDRTQAAIVAERNGWLT